MHTLPVSSMLCGTPTPTPTPTASDTACHRGCPCAGIHLGHGFADHRGGAAPNRSATHAASSHAGPIIDTILPLPLTLCVGGEVRQQVRVGVTPIHGPANLQSDEARHTHQSSPPPACAKHSPAQHAQQVGKAGLKDLRVQRCKANSAYPSPPPGLPCIAQGPQGTAVQS